MGIKLIFTSRKVENYCKNNNRYIFVDNTYYIYEPQNKQFYIYLNDYTDGELRQRFSLAHEIMHIVLGHTEQNSINECEANFGASYLLVPSSLVFLDKNNYMNNPYFINYYFDISYEAAIVSANRNYKRKNCKDNKIKNYEIVINKLLENSFKRHVKEFLNKKPPQYIEEA